MAHPAAPGRSEAKTSSGVGTGLHIEIKQIRRVDGVRGTILIDACGLVIASDLPEGMDEELSGALIVNICRAVREYADALGLGEFEDGFADTDRGRIHLMNMAEMTMGVFAAQETKAGLLQRAVQTFAEKVLEQHP